VLLAEPFWLKPDAIADPEPLPEPTGHGVLLAEPLWLKPDAITDPEPLPEPMGHGVPLAEPLPLKPGSAVLLLGGGAGFGVEPLKETSKDSEICTALKSVIEQSASPGRFRRSVSARCVMCRRFRLKALFVRKDQHTCDGQGNGKTANRRGETKIEKLVAHRRACLMEKNACRSGVANVYEIRSFKMISFGFIFLKGWVYFKLITRAS
jgi:hypothetical protein